MTAGAGEGRIDPFRGALVPATLVRRRKRFLADMLLPDGALATAHCANSGSMLGLAEPGMECLLRHAPGPARVLHWTWELVRPRPGGCWVGVDTSRPNQVVGELLREGQVPGLRKGPVRREVRYGREGSRVDFVLGDPAGPPSGLTFVEVKNTTMERDGVALFPDAVTDRGAKHMRELAAMARRGHDAAVLFFVNRADCHAFAVARDVDPAYGRAFDRAVRAGVQPIPLGMDVSPEGWAVRGVLPFA